MSDETSSSQVDSMATRVREAVFSQRDGMLAFLERLVASESPSSSPDTQAPCLDQLEEALDQVGYGVERIAGKDSGGHLLAQPRTPRDGAARQLLIGHCDTVWPVGTLKRMPVTIDGNLMRGPGIFDMKAGLTQAVFALRALHTLGLEPTVMPMMFVNSDEEIGSPESTPHIERLAAEVSRVFVMEPALGMTGKLKTARKGVGQFHLRVRGVAAHAGLDPEGGASAILELSHQIQRLFELNDPVKGVSVNVGVIDGGLRPNVIAADSQAHVDVRVPDQVEAERLERIILGLEPVTPGVELEVTGTVGRAALERTPRNQALWRLAEGLADELGFAVEQGFAGGGSDGNTTSSLAATLDGLGAVGDGAHAEHEHIDVEQSLQRCALLALLIMADAPADSEYA